MPEDVLAALDFDPQLRCELGRDGRGHDTMATASFDFHCCTQECATNPRGPAQQSLVICDVCLGLVRRMGLDCMRCGEFYRMGGWQWTKAVRIDRLVGGSKRRGPRLDELGGPER